MVRQTKVVFFDLGETLVTQNIEDNMVTRNALREISPILPKRVSPGKLFELYCEGYKINETIRSRHQVEIPIQVWMRQLLERIIGDNPSDQLVRKSIKIIVNARAANGVAFDDAYTFKYSVREGTPAVRIKDHVAEDVKTERIGRLIAVVRRVAKQKNIALVGTTHEVLVEGPAKRGSLLQARTRTNKIALLEGPAEWIGTYRRVRFTGTTGSTFTAWPVDEHAVTVPLSGRGEAAWR